MTSEKESVKNTQEFGDYWRFVEDKDQLLKVIESTVVIHQIVNLLILARRDKFYLHL